VDDYQSNVAYQKELGAGYYCLGLETGLPGFIPGQFGMLEIPGVLLRRPFSLARQIGSITEILYKVVGKGTEILKDISEKARLQLLAPLGNGFTLPLDTGDLVGVAGGYGVAPFLELASQLRKQEKRLVLYYGAQSKKDLMYLPELEELQVELHISTVDGSCGYKGLVTEPLALAYGENKPAMVWSCGPMGLLKAVGRWSEECEIACELSVEETMGCGTGVCLGCVVKNRDGNYLRSCIEGPVFRGKDLEYE